MMTTAALAKVATCNLNQWAMDFDGNLERILESIQTAKAAGARYRVGPELEVTGYGCEDHFLEVDTVHHAYESLAIILEGDATVDMLCDIGVPMLHHGTLYNCRVFCLNHKILLIRPKVHLANDGNYRELRWFTGWPEHRMGELQQFTLPISLQKVTGDVNVPFGTAVLQLLDTSIAAETCEELFVPRSTHIAASLEGAEIITNGSGSHHELRKLPLRLDLILSATRKCGGAYLYANQQGCDGSRLYYDGCAMIASNGKLVAQGAQFSVKDVEVVAAVVDLDAIRSYRGAMSSRNLQSAANTPLPRINVPFMLTGDATHALVPTRAAVATLLTPWQEIGHGPACYLWDYIRRSGASGVFLPLSGGADSSAVAAIVGIMCHMVHEAVRAGDPLVIRDVQRITKCGDSLPATPQALANFLLHTCYMPTDYSSSATRSRAAALAGEVGSYHCVMAIDVIVRAILSVFTSIAERSPRFLSQGGTPAEDLALQNIQARIRMVMSYLLAQLLPWVRGRQGFLLVLGTANVDEALRGYMTKYDCSSADINLIGSVSKVDLLEFLRWAGEAFNFKSLLSVVTATPTAELRPIEAKDGVVEHSQTDEEDMGMTYAELSWFGRLRKMERCGPVSMYRRLLQEWPHLTARQIAEKVKRFFFYYSINRHKMTTITPAYHMEAYSPDDNRFDHRQFLYNSRWPRQFAQLDALVAAAEAAAESAATGTAAAV